MNACVYLKKHFNPFMPTYPDYSDDILIGVFIFHKIFEKEMLSRCQLSIHLQMFQRYMLSSKLYHFISCTMYSNDTSL